MKGKSDFLDGDGVFDGEKAYGAVLGTFLVVSWVEIVLAFINPKVGGWADGRVGGLMLLNFGVRGRCRTYQHHR